MNNIQRLSPEIVTLVFQHLDGEDLFTCTLVSLWFYTTANPWLWRNIWIDNDWCFRKKESKINRWIQSLEEVQQQQRRRRRWRWQQPVGHLIRALYLSSGYLTDEFVSRLTAHISPHLEELELRNQGKHKVTDKSMAPLLRQCRDHLKRLALVRIGVTQESLAVLTQLESLALKGCFHLPQTILAVLRDCPLKQVHWISCYPHVLGHLDRGTALDAMRFDGLTTLTMAGIRQDFIMDQLISAWPHLSSLTLTARQSDHRRPHYFQRNLPQDCVSDDWLTRFLKAHPNLTSLGLQHLSLTDGSLTIIGTHLPGLVDLNVTGNHHLTSDGVRQFVVDHCPSLTCMDLTHCEIYVHEFPQVDPRQFDELHDDYLEQLQSHDIKKVRQTQDVVWKRTRRGWRMIRLW